MGILSGNPKDEPMHYGEVFGAWTYVTVAKGSVSAYQTVINHAGDHDLKRLLEESIKAGQQEIQQLETLLRENGVPSSPTPPERPTADLNDIPVGARFSDPEIAASVSADIAAGLVACSQQIGSCIREDIGLLFGQFHMQKAALGAKYLKLSKDKGWLIPPPLHQPQMAEQH